MIEQLEKLEAWLKNPKFAFKNLFRWQSILGLLLGALVIYYLIDTGKIL